MITKYPDGSSYATASQNAFIEHRLNSYDDLWKLNQIVDAYNSIGVRPNIFIPCLIDAQADRRFHPGESFGLKLVLDLLSRMDADFTIFHPHNPEIVKYALPDVTIMENTEFVEEALTSIGLRDSSKGILMSPDAGAFKSVIKLADELGWEGETYAANKSRKWENGQSVLTQFVDREDFGGKDIIIIDDLCIYGGTFKGLSKILRDRNIGNLFLIVSHMTVQDLGTDPVTNYFDQVYTTNSKYNFYTYQFDGTKFPSNLNILSIL